MDVRQRLALVFVGFTAINLWLVLWEGALDPAVPFALWALLALGLYAVYYRRHRRLYDRVASAADLHNTREGETVAVEGEIGGDEAVTTPTGEEPAAFVPWRLTGTQNEEHYLPADYLHESGLASGYRSATDVTLDETVAVDLPRERVSSTRTFDKEWRNRAAFWHMDGMRVEGTLFLNDDVAETVVWRKEDATPDCVEAFIETSQDEEPALRNQLDLANRSGEQAKHTVSCWPFRAGDEVVVVGDYAPQDFGDGVDPTGDDPGLVATGDREAVEQRLRTSMRWTRGVTAAAAITSLFDLFLAAI